MVREVVTWLTGEKRLTVVLEPPAYRELLEEGGPSERVETWQEGNFPKGSRKVLFLAVRFHS